MTNTSQYGRYYWCAKVSKDVSKDGEIYLMADGVRIEGGAAIFFQNSEKESRERVNLLLPPGKWWAIYAASVLDGSAVAVEHWAGEVVRGYEPPERENSKTKKSGKTYRKVTKSLRYRILERDEFKCKVCGRGQDDGVKLEVDHVHPESLGGDTTIENLQTLCIDCNRGKGNAASSV